MNQDDIIKKQADQIDTLKKAISTLEFRLRRLEQRERSSSALLNNHTNTIRSLTSQLNNRGS
jgi:chaperonin cofactor prefoldin